MANLFPTGYEDEKPVGGVEKEDSPIGYKPGVAFDYETGEFKRDGRNKIMEASGIESWKSWCINCLSTERYAHLAYSTDFGIETKAIFAAETRSAAESILVRQVTEAILADPYGRSEYLTFNNIDWSTPDAVYVDFTVYGINDVSIDIQTYITRG